MKDFSKISMGDYLSIVRRRVWYLVVVSIAVSIATIAYVQGLPSIYRSSTLITVNPRLVPEEYIKGIDHLASNELIGLVGEQLQARAFAESIVRDLHLAGPQPGAFEGAVNVVKASTNMAPLST